SEITVRALEAHHASPPVHRHDTVPVLDGEQHVLWADPVEYLLLDDIVVAEVSVGTHVEAIAVHQDGDPVNDVPLQPFGSHRSVSLGAGGDDVNLVAFLAHAVQQLKDRLDDQIVVLGSEEAFPVLRLTLKEVSAMRTVGKRSVEVTDHNSGHDQS